jgi:hypothetical protein
MKHFVLSVCAVLLVTIAAQAQLKKGEVRGVVKDSAGAVTFEGATVVLFNLKDSSVVSTTQTNSRGVFNFSGINEGSYRLYMTSVQFLSYFTDFEMSNTQLYKDFGTIAVKKGKQGEMATVVGQNPVRVAQDTVEFLADAFKTRPNAMVEDLLKKLPGVQVDKQGNITAQGQQVTRVLVDGKPFFGNDPKTATKNLPANIVDKVQVIDKKSDQAQFTGFDDGQTEKVINITIKKDKKKGFFGRAGVGVGTDDRYEGNLSFNRFNNGKQLSIIGQLNNINNEGFSFQDMMDFSGGMGGMGRLMGGGSDGGGGGMGGGGGALSVTTRGGGGGMGGMGVGSSSTGNRTVQAGGVNYSDSWGKRLTVSGSYFYNNSYTLNDQFNYRQNLFGTDSSRNTINDQHTISRSWRANHRFNFDIDWNIDSFNSLLIRPSFTYVQTKTSSNNFTINNSQKNQALSTLLQNSGNLNEQPNFSGTLLWRHKTRVKGRTFSVRVNAGRNETDGNGDNFTDNEFFFPFAGSRITDQITGTDNRGSSLNTRISYTEPLSKTRVLELFYNYSRNETETDKKAFSKDPLGKYSLFDSAFSNNFNNSFSNHLVGFNVQTKQKKYDYTLGFSAQRANLASNTILPKENKIRQNQVNIFPTARMNFNLGRSKNLRLNYRGSTNQPSASQLQPNVDSISNPQMITQGNPSLKQEFNNNFTAFYGNFNFISMKSVFAFINFSSTANKIVDSVYNPIPNFPVLQKKVPVNAGGAYNIVGNFTVGIPVKKFKTTNINSNTSFIYNQSPSFLNGKKLALSNLTLTQTLSVSYNYKDKLDLSLSGMGSYINTAYKGGTLPETKYYTYNTSFDLSYTFKKDFTVQSDIDYNMYRGRGNGFDQNFALWNASITKLLLKDKSLELKVSAFDLLKQNRSINRTVQSNYIEDTRNNVLGQYFMVGIKYNLNRFGGKGNKPFSMPKMPGMPKMGGIRIGG